MARLAILLAFASLIPGCADAFTTPGTLVDIDIIGAVIAPGKADRSKWDCNPTCGQVDEDVWLEFSGAVAGAGGPAGVVAGVITALSGVAASSQAAPDVAGVVRLEAGNGTASFLELPRVGNSYQPTWFGPPGWDDVWLTDGTRLEFQLYDVDDLDANDSIGTASIFAEDLWRAVEQGGTTEVYVGDQTGNQLIAVRVAVFLR